MSEEWNYQLRIRMPIRLAQSARLGPDDPDIEPLSDILNKHGAELINQYDAFAGYVAEAEANNPADYPLYQWTKATIEDPAKEAKYTKVFTLYVDGDEVYEKTKADALEADLKPLVGGAIVEEMTRYDTNPANNPHPPRRKD